MVTIASVTPGSRADKAGIREGDILVAIGKNEIEDVLDYRFYLADTLVTLSCLRDGKPFDRATAKPPMIFDFRMFVSD